MINSVEYELPLVVFDLKDNNAIIESAFSSC